MKATFSTASRSAACGAGTLALLLLTGVRPASAGDWSFTVTPYVWATDVGIEGELDGREVIDQDIPVSDLLEDLDTIVQLRLEAQKGAYGAMLDLFDVTLSDEASGVALPNNSGEADLKTDAAMTIFDLAGLYDPKGDKMGVVFFYGVRLINERATIDAALEPAPGTVVQERYEADDTFVDALLGLRFVRPLTRHFIYQMQADISTGGTDCTWSAAPSMSYAFGKNGRYAVSAGYRRMKVDFEDDGEFDTSMTLSGALLGLRTSF